MRYADGGGLTAEDRGAEMTEPGRFDNVRTDRLLMRRWLDSDREPFAVLNADPETMVFFPQTLDREASDRLVDLIEERFDQQGYGLWALEVAGTGEFIGFTGLNPMPDGVPGAGGVEVGWRLDRHAWHNGYATEAARAALGVAFAASAWTRSGRSPPCLTSRPRQSCGAWG